MPKMNKLFLSFCAFGSVFLFGCDDQSLQQAYQSIKGLPAQIAVDTVAKLVTAESMFSADQYEQTPDSLDKLFLENEYFILVEDFDFFYCYDNQPRMYQDVSFDSNFLVLGVGKQYGNIVMQGTAPFLSEWKNIRSLAPEDKNISGFASVLDITSGECFPIEINTEYIQSLPQNQILQQIPTEEEELENMMKEFENITVPTEDLFDSIRSKEREEPPLFPEEKASPDPLQKQISPPELQK